MSQQEELIKFAHELREATRYTWLYDRCNSIANRLEYFAKAADFDRSLKLAQQTTAALERDRAVDPASLREPYMTDKAAQCPACGGNDGDMPCAFPKANEAQPGCLKNAKDAQGDPAAWLIPDGSDDGDEDVVTLNHGAVRRFAREGITAVPLYRATPPSQSAPSEPVARVSGYHAGRCVIEPRDRTVVLPVGMALYSESVPSSPVSQGEPVAWILPNGKILPAKMVAVFGSDTNEGFVKHQNSWIPLYTESYSRVLVDAPDGAELRWCIGKEIHGRPTSHDALEYAATVGANLACGCDKCTTTLALSRRHHGQE